MHFFVLLLHEFCDLLLDLSEIGDFDGRDGNIHQVAQNEIIEIDGAHCGQVSQHPHSDLHVQTRQHIAVKRLENFLQYHLCYLHRYDKCPDRAIEKFRISEVEVADAPDHNQQTRVCDFGTVPFERLELPAQYLILLTFTVGSFLADELIGNLISQVDGNYHVGHSEASNPDFAERFVFEVADIVDDEVIPEGEEGRGEGEAEESAVHEHFHQENEKESDAGCRKNAFENLLDHAQTHQNTDGDEFLSAGEVVVDEEDEELQVGDQSDHHEDDHIDVPVEAEVQQNLGVAERCEVQLQLVCEVG